jgi:hypothetical protein
LLSIPNRFFDSVSASYYVTDNFKLSIGHLYTFGRNGLTLGSEYGFALGGGRMASLFAAGLLAEGGNNAVRGGVRIYFGQRDKTLIDRHRQDDPEAFDAVRRRVSVPPIWPAPMMPIFMFAFLSPCGD